MAQPGERAELADGPISSKRRCGSAVRPDTVARVRSSVIAQENMIADSDRGGLLVWL